MIQCTEVAHNPIAPPDSYLDPTERERETVAPLAKGFIKKETADQFSVFYQTVVTHVRNIYSKLNVHNL